jgi:hypothetical protein
MRLLSAASAFAVSVAAALPLLATPRASAPPPHVPTLDSPSTTDLLLGWGDGPDRVGARPTTLDFPGESVAAVALGPDGATWLLDRLNRRVVRLAAGAARIVRSIEVPPDAEDLAIGPDGTVAVYSALRARVWLFDADGPAGEVPVPRELEQVLGISLGASRQVLLHTAYQETFALGSPAVPQLTTAILANKREGVAFLPDGAGLAVRRRDDGRAELLVLVTGERTTERARFPLGRNVLAARVLGVSGETACVRLESAGATMPLKVQRRLVCLDARSGRTVLEQALPPPGQYLPRRELAVGATTGRVVHVFAESAGLRVQSRLIGGGR